MKKRSFRLHDGKHGAALAVRVTPRASRNEIVEVLSDGTIKIHVTAPPVGGEANEAVLKFLAEVLETPVSNLEVVAGANGRDKLISVLNMDAEVVHKKIIQHLG
ncbi:MAG: DUF167 domain-containing protein [Anaerolineales bacterium]|nr:DUF167 domain-containing protein [Anaerolineales bacterium]MCX7609388.1 DUF167 domain-containing protein [Anaerolineales bacterium]MDW8227201.1 DUF167 domain-containing protein [Anaerolineales bacterium]